MEPRFEGRSGRLQNPALVILPVEPEAAPEGGHVAQAFFKQWKKQLLFWFKSL